MPENCLCYENYVYPPGFDHTTQPQREALCAELNKVNTYRAIFPILTRYGIPFTHSLTDAELDEVLMESSLLDRHNFRRANSERFLFEPVCSVTLLDPAALCVLLSNPPDYLRQLAALCYKEDSMLRVCGLVIDGAVAVEANRVMGAGVAALSANERVWYIESYDGQLVVYLTGTIADAAQLLFSLYTPDAMLIVTQYENLYLDDKGVPFAFAPDGSCYRRSGLTGTDRDRVEARILSTLRLRKLNLLLS